MNKTKLKALQSETGHSTWEWQLIEALIDDSMPLSAIKDQTDPYPWIDKCPDWVMWQTTDESGETFGSGLITLGAAWCHNWTKVGDLKLNPDWRQSLRQRPVEINQPATPELDLYRDDPGQDAVGHLCWVWDKDEVIPAVQRVVSFLAEEWPYRTVKSCWMHARRVRPEEL